MLFNNLHVFHAFLSAAEGWWGEKFSRSSLSGSTTYTFDNRNRLHTALANGHTTTYHYLQNGWLDTVTQGNGTGVDYDYDNAGRVTKILNSQAGGALLSQFDYTYDDNGNRTGQIETQNGFTADRVVTTDYVYDDLNRLENFTHTTTDNGTATGVEQHSYTFYPSYDRKTETVVKDGATQTQRTYTYDETYWVEA